MFFVVFFLFCIFISAYLSSPSGILNSIAYGKIEEEPMGNSALSAMRFLTTQTARVQKKYETPPKQLGKSPYNVSSEIGVDSVTLFYQFPLLDKVKSILTLKLEPQPVSNLVDTFGVNTPAIEQNEDGFAFNKPNNLEDFNLVLHEFKQGSFSINEKGEVGVDYAKLVHNSLPFSTPIAAHILNELTRIGRDGYVERVQAVLNFVQFIPYGQPEFNVQNFYFHGLALPPESLVLNYSDCDSKSILFASILAHFIDYSNIILVLCEVAEKDGQIENHMMVGVRGLKISGGQTVEVDNEHFHLLETTSPCSIGAWHWDVFHLKGVIHLLK
jgi:hypothetical protein